MDVAPIQCLAGGGSWKSFMVINTNLAAEGTATRLMFSSSRLAQSLQRLSSGSKVASPADDSAGLAVSMRLGAQLARLGAAQSNLTNAVSFKQTQDAYLGKVNEALNRMGELSLLSLDVTKSAADRALYQQEFHALGGYLGSAATKDFNGVSLFNGANLYVTTDADIENGIFRVGTMTMIGISLGGVTYTAAANDDIGTTAGAAGAVNDVKAAINQLASDRANVGLNLETLGYYHEHISTLKNNLSAANSRITDVDVAQESTNYAKYNILVQAGTAMLAQANALPQSVLKLIG